MTARFWMRLSSKALSWFPRSLKVVKYRWLMHQKVLVRNVPRISTCQGEHKIITDVDVLNVLVSSEYVFWCA